MDRNSFLQFICFCIGLSGKMRNRFHNVLCLSKAKGMDINMAQRKTDRRTIMTKEIVKDAFLELLRDTPYEKITVTALCRQAGITRATFYLHYDNIDDVLNELLDDALRLTEFDAPYPADSAMSAHYIELEKNLKESDPDPDALLPVCQRAADNPKYRILFMDESLSHSIINKLYNMQKTRQIPEIMKTYHVTEWEADKIFLFMLHGNFAVNKSLGWEKNQDWYHMQEIIRNLLRKP